MMHLGFGWRVLVGSMLAVGTIAATAAAPALAAPPSHAFDPQLSLTGGCTVNESDEVPDPSCPYPSFPAGPSESFNRTTGIALDPYGNVYVAVGGPSAEDKAHIDIFDSESRFITELHVADPIEPGNKLSPRTLAVDSEGYLYVFANGVHKRLLRYDPKPGEYDPANGEIAYEATPAVIRDGGSDYASLAVNPQNDHLLVNYGTSESVLGVFVRSAIIEFGSGEDGNPLLDDEAVEVCCFDGPGLAIDASRGRLYATDQATVDDPLVIKVFELAAPHAEVEEIDGSSTPEGGFLTERALSLAADESTGNVFAYDQEKKNVIYELSEDGQYLASIKHSLLSKEFKQQVVVDNGANSPHGAENDPEGRYLWATAQPTGVGHAYAFKPTHVAPPEVEASVGEVSEDEAELKATIDPGQAETTYVFEYLSLAQLEAGEFEATQIAGEGTIEAGAQPVTVSAQATGLTPGTAYVFFVVAENEAGEDEDEAEFKTYPSIAFGPCPNDALRTGPSSALPDCRAYELVTPPDTSGRPPMGLGFISLPFPSLPASPTGDRLSFRIENGLIPGLDATASFPGDPYLSSRGPGGWGTIATGGKGTEASAAAPGGRSPEQTYSVWAAEGLGPKVIGGERTIYVHYPDGHSELLGQGSLATDPQPAPKLISEGATHMLFASSAHLEKEAPEKGQLAIYDRTPAGTHVVSLLPGDVTPSASQPVTYKGSSLDGRGVAFTVTQSGVTSLYLRRENQTTYKIGDGLTFEGVAEGGGRIFYLEAGNLKAFDAVSAKTISFAGGGDVTVVNVSADGSTAYFVSPDKLTSAQNPLGKQAALGKENLYRSDEGTISFVGIVSEADVEGESGNIKRNGLGLWADAVGGEGGGTPGRFAADPSRTTADGGVLLFQSDAGLTPYDSEGTRQVYRYDAAANELACLSCNPTGASPEGDALLQDVADSGASLEPNTAYDIVQNLSANGHRAFFESPDPLVAADTDGLQDVYEWEAQGVGSCTAPGGCLYLISSGHSGKVNYLYAASSSGEDVFFRTSDRLVGADKEEIPSIYDARVGGGFAEAGAAGQCEGEGCRPQLTPTPGLSAPPIPPGRAENVKPKCPKGKRKVKRHGKVRCVKKRHHHKRHTHKRRKGAGK